MPAPTPRRQTFRFGYARSLDRSNTGSLSCCVVSSAACRLAAIASALLLPDDKLELPGRPKLLFLAKLLLPLLLLPALFPLENPPPLLNPPLPLFSPEIPLLFEKLFPNERRADADPSAPTRSAAAARYRSLLRS